MTVTTIEFLIPQLIQGTATDEQVAAFEQWLSQADAAAVVYILDKYREQQLLLAQTSQMPTAFDPQQLHRQIEQQIDTLEKSADGANTNAQRKWPARIFTLRTAAAAAVIVALMTTALLWSSRNTTTLAPVAERYKNDLPAGANKAILTLDDGKKIVLQPSATTHEVALAKQDGLEITNQQNTVQYQSNYKHVPTTKMVYNTLTTPKGGQYQIVLSDGTKVWLNTASQLRFPVAFSGNEREVSLTGEAYFEVAKNAQKPFVVSVGDTKVTVLGTHFNVNAYTDEQAIQTTLVEGSVKVSDKQHSELLTPGNKATYRNNQFEINAANVDMDLAWKSGFFNFYKADVATMMRQIARWYNAEVVYERDAPTSRYVGEIDRTATLAQTLKILELSGLHFTIEGNKITVLNK